MRQATLCLLLRGNEILFALKKRGFGEGRWNGVGGKFDKEKGDKNILDAAIRETKEEIGVQIKNAENAGMMRFRFPHRPEWDQDVHLFLVKSWEGEPKETEEMSPKWFNFCDIPYDKMWDDDKHWLPLVLSGRKIKADFTFREGDKIDKFNIKII